MTSSAAAERVETTTAGTGDERLAHVPAHLRTRVLYHDDDVVVIDKPSNLRSVPGHANPPPPGRQNEKKSHRLTAQEAWVSSIRTFREGVDTDDDEANEWLRKLALTPKLDSIPRKWGPFLRYCQRNQRRLSGDTGDTAASRNVDGAQLEAVARTMHERIQGRQIPLLNLPESTKDEESAFGQLKLLGFVEDSSRTRLFVVHRLDCETSGVMVFARDEQAASKLSQAWRERDKVTKTYLARVKDWPPFQKHRQVEGRIDAPLAPSEERLKWKVHGDGKPSNTLWKIRGPSEDSIVLELTPVTGRTHQLRIHCAHVGSGIEGDSLYGDEQMEWDPGNAVLCLHAHKLSFPHPRTGEQLEFASMPSWYDATYS